MKKLSHHIEHLRTKPHHVRRKVAVGVAAFGSGFVGLVWLVGSLASGTFAVPNTSFADLGKNQNTIATTSANTVTSGLAGVAAAAKQESTAPAHIEIVDTSPSTSVHAEQTTIPF